MKKNGLLVEEGKAVFDPTKGSADSKDGGRRRKSLVEIILQPTLSRCFATCLTSECQMNIDLREQITNAYCRLPFHGPALVLSDGEQITNDSWRCALEMELDLHESQSSTNGGLIHFDLEAWLSKKIMAEGTIEQKEAFQIFLQQLDEYTDPTASQIFEDNLVIQPLTEVEVYRDLANVSISQNNEEEDNDDNHHVRIEDDDQGGSEEKNISIG
mmetsp:Transcript_7269/g.10129  ORF Transcript_7269/g.10129 Transcript_7269/m.10129 type:complete len:214 (+) Transcript_7269:80-721(+)|eukprot:CAMPEP_0197297924 /NCGR_PEP_ID=MMETSP0890-20130614/42306_1 /TAXON_ID=44058 ORGANISM="Aureoumbra lagunensis, Strain CCMP1510" /NCGR_SAMPLE_ID=MMETSP0890 /ASSEMBLY_ACC=CAM_ASM_000533 /LENGTH=213 /DNA_ID=CAMNT_0042775329 /DNA_START=76 /DNA_END=717 /DNA_ORIENTATION=+